MEKNAVIAFRDALIANGKHRAIRIAFDNGINLSLSSDIVIWDDDKELVIGFTADGTSGSFEAGLPIRIICSTYENIQFILANTNVEVKKEYKEKYALEDLTTIIDSLKSASSNITDDDKTKIINWYSKLLDPKHDLSHKAYNPIDIRRD